MEYGFQHSGAQGPGGPTFSFGFSFVHSFLLILIKQKDVLSHGT